jgi:hypothetical protein
MGIGKDTHFYRIFFFFLVALSDRIGSTAQGWKTMDEAISRIVLIILPT